jgi:hypothetical protein
VPRSRLSADNRRPDHETTPATAPQVAHAENRLDSDAYRCVGVAARSRQNDCVHLPHCGRLTPGACLQQRPLPQKVRNFAALSVVAYRAGGDHAQRRPSNCRNAGRGARRILGQAGTRRSGCQRRFGRGCSRRHVRGDDLRIERAPYSRGRAFCGRLMNRQARAIGRVFFVDALFCSDGHRFEAYREASRRILPLS